MSYVIYHILEEKQKFEEAKKEFGDRISNARQEFYDFMEKEEEVEDRNLHLLTSILESKLYLIFYF